MTEPLPSIEAVLLDGLTGGADETPALSVLRDAHSELAALTALLGLDLRGEPLDRDPVVTLLDGIERRLRAGLALIRFAPAAPAAVPEDVEITRDAAPGGAS